MRERPFPSISFLAVSVKEAFSVKLDHSLSFLTKMSIYIYEMFFYLESGLSVESC